MCGRYSQTKGWNDLAPRFKLECGPVAILTRFNIAPAQQAPVIGLRKGKRAITHMRWGLIPSSVKDPKKANNPINARAETLTQKPSFKELLSRRRCLIPADGFFEWRRERSGGKSPIRFHLDNEPFAFAGLWDKWRAPDGKEIASYTIITTAPNEVCAQVHDRMPAILTGDDEAAWLDPAEHDPAKLFPLLRPYEGKMLSYEVAPLVNSPQNDVRECILPVNPGTIRDHAAE